MSDDQTDFLAMLRRIEGGDASAVEELLSRYGSALRLMVRSWMRTRGADLNRLVDSSDIYQTVMVNFLRLFRSGRCELNRPDDMLKLLNVMARNELSEQLRRLKAGRRDIRRDVAIEQAEHLPADDPSPSVRLHLGEQVAAVYGQLTIEERRIAELRMLDHGWPSIASRLGGTPDGRRKQWARVVRRLNSNA